MRHAPTNRVAILALMTWTIAACETSTELETTDTLDTEAALQDFAAMDAILSSSGFMGFVALGNRAPLSNLGGLGAVRNLPALLDTDAAGNAAIELAQQIADGALADRLISDLHLGKTFVYDAGEDDYVVDPTRTGAPTDGVRFILYKTDSSGNPIAGMEIGHADLIDEGASTTDQVALRLLVVANDRTIANYTIRVDTLDEDGTISIGGFLQNNTDRLDFDMVVTGSDEGADDSINITFSLEVKGRSFSVTGSLVGISDHSDDGTVQITIRHKDDTLRLKVTGKGDSITGTFHLNGDVLAHVSGNSENPTFTGADGGGLTAGEISVLIQSVHVVGDVLQFFETLGEPIEELITLAIVL